MSGTWNQTFMDKVLIPENSTNSLINNSNGSSNELDNPIIQNKVGEIRPLSTLEYIDSPSPFYLLDLIDLVLSGSFFL